MVLVQQQSCVLSAQNGDRGSPERNGNSHGDMLLLLLLQWMALCNTMLSFRLVAGQIGWPNGPDNHDTLLDSTGRQM